MFAGGYFSEAGGEPAYGIAEWDDDLTAAPIPVPTLGPRLSPAPNPFALIVDLRYELAAPAHARIEIFDIAGHMVERVFDGNQGAGAQHVVWQPASSHVKAGVYFARLQVGIESRVVRVVRVP
jgi:hypothetical protein